MRVLMACSQYYPTPGGTERQAHQLARSLIARGHEVRVLTMRVGGQPSEAVVDGVPVRREIRAIDRGMLFGASYLCTSLYALLALGRWADVLHAQHLYLDAAAATVAGRLLRIPVLAKVACGGSGGDLSRLRRSRAGRLLLSLILRRIDRVVTLSQATESEVLTSGFEPARVVRIPNGVDIERFYPSQGNRSAEPTLLFLGRLEHQKGLDTLITAWARIAAEIPGVTLAIGGQGPLAEALAALAAECRVADRVRFLGVVSSPEVHLRAATAFVLPSRYEGLPNALLEAMATGLPCVATTIGGTMDVATDGQDALLVPPDDSDALAVALRRVLTDRVLASALGRAARQRVVHHFSLQATVTQYEKLYQEMRDGARP